ncbi:MAG TPA: secretin N-terminal domain-containing protein [Candidatus Bathyarchaeia archaeon]|nr:secretin N-terminal domain-containing protein [Candidatus Bathyarchaeia archaeon]
MRIAGLVVVMSLVLTATGLSQTADSPVQLKDVSIDRASDGVSVTVKTSGPTQYEAKLIDSPTRLVIDLSGTAYSSTKTRWTSGVDPVKEVRGSQWRKGIARVVVEMTRNDVGYHIDETPDGLVVAIETTNGQAAKFDTAPATPKAASKPVVIAAAKPDDKPAASAPAPVAEAPQIAPKPAVVAAVKPVEKPAPIVEPAPAPKEIAAVLTEVPAATPAPVPPRQMLAQASTTPTPTASTSSSGDKLISLDFKDADVVNLLRILAAESGRNIVVGDDVKGRVTISLRNVTWEQALDTILEVRGLAKVERDGVIRIVSLDQLTKEREAQARVEAARRNAEIDTRTKLAEAQIKETELATKKLAADAAAAEAAARGPLREEVIRLSYADPDDVAKTLQGILGIPPSGTQAIPSTVIPSVPAAPTVVPSQPTPLNPALGQLPAPQTPYPPAYGPGGQPVMSVSQDVLSKGITVMPNKATNSIFIRHYEADLERIKKLIREQLDVPLPQIKIEARMEILDRNSLESIGVQWGGAGAANTKGSSTLVAQGFTGADATRTGIAPNGITPANPNLSLANLLPVAAATGLPTGGNLVNLPFSNLPNSATANPAGGISFGIVGTNFNVNLALQALAQRGKTRTLAHPEIVTVENNKAAFTIGEEVPYATVSSAGTQVQFKEAVLRLEVTPTVIRERIDGQEIRKVKMTVLVENNSVGATISPAAGVTVPIIDKRRAETLVLIREGERLIIGGVTQNVQQVTINKVPMMGDIPVLGWLFKQREDFETGRELVVFLTPSILRTDGARAAVSGK